MHKFPGGDQRGRAAMTQRAAHEHRPMPQPFVDPSHAMCDLLMGGGSGVEDRQGEVALVAQLRPRIGHLRAQVDDGGVCA